MPGKYLGFLIPEALEAKLLALLEKVKAAENKKVYAMDLFDVIVALSDEGLEYFFLEPLRRAKVGGLSFKLISGAISIGKKGIIAAGRGIVKGLDNQQLMIVVDLLETSITVRPAANTSPHSADSPKEDEKG